ncbi:MAG: bifunctional aspartate transaminase/aspartate 4-decarboxylase, partial [Planctomycetota bacterium]
EQEMFAGSPPAGRFDLFATEGGTAAMAYVFNSLMENKLLHLGDTIALGSPIFTPYLEIPRLSDYQFVELEIEQAEADLWQYPDREIEKLADPAVKAFFVVHPSNPTSVAMHPDCLDKIGKLVRERRPDLILLTDDVYGTFVDGFRSLAAVAPRNTILVYSYSKYFGATGWRLGVIGMHEDNVLDERIRALPAADRDALAKRYTPVALKPAEMKLIERMVADSRAVALHHTAGLSTPQQVQMALFSLYCLLDTNNTYKQAAHDIVRARIASLYEAIGMETPSDALNTNYYTTIDVPQLARKRFGQEFTDWLVASHEPIDFVWRLANEKSVVLMDGGGFDAPNMSVRVSLANLDNEAYPEIGKAISDLLAEYHARWQVSA